MSETGGRLCLEERVLVLAPTARDGEMSRSILTEAGMTCLICRDPCELGREIRAGCGAVLLTEEILLHDDYPLLIEALRDQPPWSDLPVIILARGGADSPVAARALDTLGNVIVLEQPVRISTLISAVRMALRARRRQYQLCEHLEERQRAEEALKEADRRKDEFLAMLAHELRNPVSAISTAVQVSRQTGTTDDDFQWSKEVIDRQVRHLTRLIDDLLDISRITRGKIQLHKAVISLTPVVQSAVEATRHLIEGRHHGLTVSLEPGPLYLEADPTRVEQIIVNLLTNAAKYTERGGRIELAARHEGPEIVITVRDTGIGIPPEMLSRVFDMFTQVERSLVRSEGGLGIGLTLVRELARMHGGSVTAASAGLGQGSEFTVRLPAAQEAPAGSPKPSGAGRGAAREHAAQRCARILIVDDNVDAAKGLARLLRLLGHAVWLAHDGVAALEAAHIHRPQVVLLDIGLPGMDGYQVAERLRAEEDLKDCLLIAISGYGQERDRHRSQAAGFDHHLVKPVDYDALLALLAQGSPVTG
ncbi:MAG: response regulator [Isosphaeraceae bacterium]|nr:response regulator [Isosphaeraceae bacterium]